MKTSILVVVAIMAVAYLIDLWRKSRADKSSDFEESDRQEFVTADEAEPSHTGLMRVQRILDKKEEAPQNETESTSQLEQEHEEDQKILPDPFKR